MLCLSFSIGTPRFVVKGEEDVEVDSRIAKILRVLQLPTYDVIPFNERVGLLQYVENTVTLKSFVKSGVSECLDNSISSGNAGIYGITFPSPRFPCIINQFCFWWGGGKVG